MGYLDLCRAFSSVTFFIFFQFIHHRCVYVVDITNGTAIFFFASLPAVTFTKVQCYLHHSL